MKRFIPVWSAALIMLALPVSRAVGEDTPPAVILIPASELQALLDDGWMRVGPVVLIKDINGDGEITPPEETRVLAEGSQ